MSKDLGIRITGVGRALPTRVLSNHDLEKLVDTSDEWIVARTGIKERRIAGEGESTGDLGAIAAKEALERAGIDAKEIDLVLCATSTPDKVFPSTACHIQAKIGAAPAPAFDILAACSGFSYALKIADSFVKSGSAKKVLVVASEVYSRIVDWSDRTTCVLFGDGAAACVLEESDGVSGIVASNIYADGVYGDLLCAGGLKYSGFPGDKENSDENHLIKMKGQETFKVAVKKMSDASRKILSENGFTASDVSLIVPHQANIRIINAVAKSLNVNAENVFVNVHKYGNT
ncbi:3-oxoacyl-[acyl-carrier-protein] synthase, KASIII, partial [hydrothermal vent metagenome]